MTETIPPDLFAHLVGLAALELDAAEAEYLRRQLNHQLKAIHELESIPLDESVPVTSHGVPYTAATSPASRPDVWQPYPNPQEILEQAPLVEENYVIVPEIPHTGLD